MKNEKSGSRLKEITAVLRKHELTRGITPEKLRLILEDLGPTFIKIGQIMSLHSDVLPKKYCDELMKLLVRCGSNAIFGSGGSDRRFLWVSMAGGLFTN